MDDLMSLITKLKESKDVRERSQAAFNLGELRDPRAVPALIEALKREKPEQVWKTDSHWVGDSHINHSGYETVDVRESVILALGKIGHVNAIEPLMQALVEIGYAPSLMNRINVSLAKIGAVDSLIDYLKDERSGVPSAAAIALGKIGDRRAVKPIIAALLDNRISPFEAGVATGLVGDEQTIEFLADAFRTARDPTSRRRIVGTFEFWSNSKKNKQAFEALVAALKDRDPSVRARAVSALGNSQNPQAVDPLIHTLLDGTDWAVRAQAANALRDLGDIRAVGPLSNILRYQRNAATSEEVKFFEEVYNALQGLDRRPRSWLDKLLGRRKWAQAPMKKKKGRTY